MQGRRGYTLIELLLVVAILAIAALLLVPSLVRRDTYAVEAAMRQLVADITYAQSDAMAGQGYRRVQFLRDPSPPAGRENTYIGWSVFESSGPGESELDEPEAGYRYLSANYVPPKYSRDDDRKPPSRPLIVNLREDSRFAGVWIESLEIDGGQTWITFDQLGGAIVGSEDLFGICSLRVRSDNLTYDVEIHPFNGKVSIARAEDPLGP